MDQPTKVHRGSTRNETHSRALNQESRRGCCPRGGGVAYPKRPNLARTTGTHLQPRSTPTHLRKRCWHDRVTGRDNARLKPQCLRDRTGQILRERSTPSLNTRLRFPRCIGSLRMHSAWAVNGNSKCAHAPTANPTE